MLRKIVATGLLGFGVSGITLVHSAMSETLDEKIDALRALIQNQTGALRGDIRDLDVKFQNQTAGLKGEINALDERLTKHIADGHRPASNGGSPPAKIVVQIQNRHRYYPRYWCPPPWWEPWW